MDSLNGFDRTPPSGLEKKWITVQSGLEGADGQKKDIKIELMEDGKPRAMAFFDISGTLAHIGNIHSRAIVKLFPNQDPAELQETFRKGFKLGSSFREFDRMHGIYIDGHTEWKDPEVYLRERFTPHQKEIDEPGSETHEITAKMLQEYGVVAAQITEELSRQNPEEFEKSNIAPIFKLARMYARLGIPMVGFTTNEKGFTDGLSKYLKLSDIFLDIATSEDMIGGGKEVAIPKLITNLESRGIPIPKNRLIFVGDSLRGDIGTSLAAKSKDATISGQGILVLQDKEALAEIEKQISADPKLQQIVESMDVEGLVVSDVPLDDDGHPILLSRVRDQFLKKL